MKYSQAFEDAVNHVMRYEVGPFWKLTTEVEQGLINTPAQRRAVGYVNDPLDTGGETKYGIAANAHTDVDIKKLDWARAKDIFYRKYWLSGSCDKLSPRVGVLHFDCCVNHGVHRASIFLQRSVGVADDGQIGPITLNAAAQINSVRLCELICGQRELFYHRIVKNNPSQKRFLNGWLSRCEEVKQYVMSLN